MRRSKTERIDRIVEKCLENSDMGYRLKELRLFQSWEKVLGKSIQQNTIKLYIRNRTLFVTVNSSVIKHQLSGLKESLISALNKEVEFSLIDDIVLRTGSH